MVRPTNRTHARPVNSWSSFAAWSAAGRQAVPSNTPPCQTLKRRKIQRAIGAQRVCEADMLRLYSIVARSTSAGASAAGGVSGSGTPSGRDVGTAACSAPKEAALGVTELLMLDAAEG